ncbi:MAG: hypothetical protein EXR75_11090 [Myxococcales bacterium]|nr:hypothetical protein [Myxococcales bacterium]
MTGKQRVKRIERLLSIRERDRDSARGQLADAQRRTEDARIVRSDAEVRWTSEVERTAVPVENASIQDFALQRMHLNTLRRVADRARLKLEHAATEEDRKRDTATVAQREVRKMELWSDAERERQRVETLSFEQKLSDEHAAQLVQKTSR